MTELTCPTCAAEHGQRGPEAPRGQRNRCPHCDVEWAYTWTAVALSRVGWALGRLVGVYDRLAHRIGLAQAWNVIAGTLNWPLNWWKLRCRAAGCREAARLIGDRNPRFAGELAEQAVRYHRESTRVPWR